MSGLSHVWSITLRLKIAQKPFIILSLGPKALKHESLEPYPEGPNTHTSDTYALKYPHTKHFKAKVYYIGLHGPSGLG